MPKADPLLCNSVKSLKPIQRKTIVVNMVTIAIMPPKFEVTRYCFMVPENIEEIII